MVRPRKNPTKSNALPVKEGNITKQLQATAELSEAEEQAIELIKQGKLSESEAIYRRLIAEGKVVID